MNLNFTDRDTVKFIEREEIYVTVDFFVLIYFTNMCKQKIGNGNTPEIPGIFRYQALFSSRLRYPFPHPFQIISLQNSPHFLKL